MFEKNAKYDEDSDIFYTNYIPLNEAESNLSEVTSYPHHEDVTIDHRNDGDKTYVSVMISNATQYFRIPDEVEDFHMVSFNQSYDVQDGALFHGTFTVVMVKGDPEHDIGRWWSIRVHSSEESGL